MKRQIALFQMINRIFLAHFKFNSNDEAREFFLNLQNEIKNLNSKPFESEDYHKAKDLIEGKIHHASQTISK